MKLPQPRCWSFCHQPCPAPEPPSCTRLAPVASAPHWGGIKWHLPAQLGLLLLCLPWGKLARKGLPLVVLKMQCSFFSLVSRNSFDSFAGGSPRYLVLVEVAELQWSDKQPPIELCNREWWWPGGYPVAVTKTCRSLSGKCKMVMNKVRVTNKHLSLVGDLPGHSNGPKGSGVSVLRVSWAGTASDKINFSQTGLWIWDQSAGRSTPHAHWSLVGHLWASLGACVPVPSSLQLSELFPAYQRLAIRNPLCSVICVRCTELGYPMVWCNCELLLGVNNSHQLLHK